MVEEWITDMVERDPGSTYLEDARSQRRVTYADLHGHVRRWRSRLHRLTVEPGELVALQLADHLDFATTLVAVLAAGYGVAPLDPGAPDDDNSRRTSLLGPAATIFGDGDGDGGEPAVVRHRPGRHASTGVPGPAAVSGGPDAAARGAGICLSTSGTSGTPKVVWLPEPQLVHVAAGIAAHHRLGPADRCLCPLPLFHINAEVVGLLASLAAGASVVLDDRFHRAGFWELVDSRQVTWINAVPAILAVLGTTPPPDRPPARVRFVRSASAPLAPATLHRFERHVGIPVLETYGMTEAASMITANPRHGLRKPGSVGLPVGCELRVVDGANRPVAAGCVGQVAIRGPGIITSYVSGGRPDVFDLEGWFHTGDLGRLDDDGYLFLAGRSDDVINRGGENIYPHEVEAVMLQHPDVLAAMVTGAPDPVLGEVPVAFVVLRTDRRPPGGDTHLRSWCADRLSPYKVPGQVLVVAELPTGPTGKVDRRRASADAVAAAS